ncbi:endonuclease/exonuclease/phosphatase family protein [Winogradskyella ludwigii]|uniref:endonuclease/exonuclease/phosphatase family protein n=1 Tax=Winogradskyella ludwigii TaxID=2686076 RepID=UPI0015CAFEA4|nr:endonuclease/exonuclease/phosphatase family protein [Winogradskyella ludwigii]
MKSKFSRIDKLSISCIVAMVLGIISSYVNLGMLSVFFSVIMPLLFVLNLLLAIYGLFKRKYIYSIGVFIFLLCYNFFFQFSKVTKLENKDAISILTYNVRAFLQPLADNPNKNATTEIIKFIDSVSADIVVFQESSYKEGREITGYPYHFLGYRENIEKSLLTIYSKYPIINKGYIDFPNSKNNAIYADIIIKADTIRVYNAHLQSFVVAPHILANKYNDYSYWKGLNTKIKKQIEQAKLIKNHANKSMKKVIICGDFNATPYSQTYRILEKGLNDSYLSNGNGFGETYSLFNYPLRLDYFLNSDKISVLNHFNYDLNLSDHEPIVMKFRIK